MRTDPTRPRQPAIAQASALTILVKTPAMAKKAVDVRISKTPAKCFCEDSMEGHYYRMSSADFWRLAAVGRMFVGSAFLPYRSLGGILRIRSEWAAMSSRL